MGALAVPRIDVGPLVLSADAKEGALRLTKLAASGKDVDVIGDGRVQLRDDPSESVLDLNVRFRINDAYRGKNDVTKSLFGAPGTTGQAVFELADPRIKQSKRPDGILRLDDARDAVAPGLRSDRQPAEPVSETRSVRTSSARDSRISSIVAAGRARARVRRRSSSASRRSSGGREGFAPRSFSPSPSPSRVGAGGGTTLARRGSGGGARTLGADGAGTMLIRSITGGGKDGVIDAIGVASGLGGGGTSEGGRSDGRRLSRSAAALSTSAFDRVSRRVKRSDSPPSP